MKDQAYTYRFKDTLGMSLNYGQRAEKVLNTGGVNIYTGLADFYDKFIYDVDYAQWADYIEAIFKRFGYKPQMILDLGCGTGSFCIQMAKRGYEMIGIDLSAEMLAQAKTKCVEEGQDILLLNQDMTRFELYGTVDAIVCLLDSTNYITSKKDLKRLFKLVNNYLNPGGMFIFDINTPYKMEHLLGNNIYYDLGDDMSYIWQNSFDSRKRICEFDLTIFTREGSLFRKFDETHYERAYTADELSVMLREADLEVRAIYDELCFSKPKEKSKRIFFTCVKK